MKRSSSSSRVAATRRVSHRKHSIVQLRSAMEAVANAIDEERLVADTVASARTTQAMSENLLSTQLFTALSQDTRAKLRTALHPRHYSAGMFVCRQGMRGNTLFIITSGEVEVRWMPSNAIPGDKTGAGGDDDIEDETGGGGGDDGDGGDVIARFRPGDFFGEAALFNKDCLRTASIVVSSPSLECMALRRQEISRMHIDRESFFNTLMQLATERNMLRKANPGDGDSDGRESHRFKPGMRGRRATRAMGRMSLSGLQSILESEYADQEQVRAAATVTEAAAERRQFPRATQSLVVTAVEDQAQPQPQKQAQMLVSTPTRQRRASMQPSKLWSSAKRRTELVMGSVTAFRLPAVLQDSLYAKFRYRLRLKPQLVTRFSSVIRSISFTGGESDIESMAKTSRAILERSPGRREEHQVAFIAEMCSRVPFRKRFCSTWTWSQWVALMRTAKYDKLQPGQAVYRRGDDAQRIYIVLAGCIELQRLTNTEEQEATFESIKEEEEDGSDEDDSSRAPKQSESTNTGLRSSRRSKPGSKRVSHSTTSAQTAQSSVIYEPVSPKKYAKQVSRSPAEGIVSPRTQDASVLAAHDKNAVDADEISGPVSMDLGPGGHFGEAALQRMQEGSERESGNVAIKRQHDAVACGVTTQSGEVRRATAKGVVRNRTMRKQITSRAAAMKNAQLAAQAAIANPTCKDECLVEVLSFRVDDYSRISGSLEIEELARFMRSVPIFADIPVLRLQRMASQATVRVIKRGTKLLSSGDEAPALYIVREGTLQCQLQPLRRRRGTNGSSAGNSVQSIHETPLVLCASGVGSVIGESGILNATSTAASGPAIALMSAPVALSSSSMVEKTTAAAATSTPTLSVSSVGLAPSLVHDTATTHASAAHEKASVGTTKPSNGRQYTEYADVIAASSQVELIVFEPPYTRILEDSDVISRLKQTYSVQSKWLRKSRVPSAKKERVLHRMTAQGRAPPALQCSEPTEQGGDAVTAGADDVQAFLVRSQQDVLSEAGSLATPFSPVPTASERAAMRLRVQATQKVRNEQERINKQNDEYNLDQNQEQDQDQDQDQEQKREQKQEQQRQGQRTVQHPMMDSGQQMWWNARSPGNTSSSLDRLWSRKTRMCNADERKFEVLAPNVHKGSMEKNLAVHAAVPDAYTDSARPQTADSILHPSFALRCGFAKAGMLTTVPGTRLPVRRIFDRFGGAYDEPFSAPAVNTLVTKQRTRRPNEISFAQTPYIQYAETRRTAAGHRASPGRGLRPPQHAFYQVQSRIDYQRGELDAIARQCNSAGNHIRELHSKVVHDEIRAESKCVAPKKPPGMELHESYSMCNSSTVKKMFVGSIIDQAEALTIEVAQTPEGRTALRL